LNRKNIMIALFLGLFLGTGAIFSGLYAYAGLYGINVVLKRGGSVFAVVTPNDPRISSSMRMALQAEVPPATSGQFSWRILQQGFEVAELPVVSQGIEVDRILLTRLEPTQFRFEVLTAPAGHKDLGDWMKSHNPLLVINGSYFDRYGLAVTPLKTQGVQMGPSPYNATHGIFTVTGSEVAIHDLSSQDWSPLLSKAREAMVSYPLLLAADGSTRVKSDRRWLAARSFVGIDKSGHVVFGTSRDAFFSLERLGSFLKDAPLDLKIALNLDGGPLACQAVSVGSYVRDFCGDWETQTKGNDIILLQRLAGNKRWALPIVLAVFPK
jgi:Phosphodiester glycosidase